MHYLMPRIAAGIVFPDRRDEPQILHYLMPHIAAGVAFPDRRAKPQILHYLMPHIAAGIAFPDQRDEPQILYYLMPCIAAGIAFSDRRAEPLILHYLMPRISAGIAFPDRRAKPQTLHLPNRPLHITATARFIAAYASHACDRIPTKVRLAVRPARHHIVTVRNAVAAGMRVAPPPAAIASTHPIAIAPTVMALRSLT